MRAKMENFFRLLKRVACAEDAASMHGVTNCPLSEFIHFFVHSSIRRKGCSHARKVEIDTNTCLTDWPILSVSSERGKGESRQEKMFFMLFCVYSLSSSSSSSVPACKWKLAGKLGKDSRKERGVRWQKNCKDVSLNNNETKTDILVLSVYFQLTIILPQFPCF